MSGTGLDAATLARSLRDMVGDGSREWVLQPIQTSVLLDIADMLAENAKLREQVRDAEHEESVAWDRVSTAERQTRTAEEHNTKLRELCKDMWRLIEDLDATPYVTEREGNNPAVTWLDEDWSVHDSCRSRMRELVEVDE